MPVRVPWFELRARLVRVPLIADVFLPDADLVVATSWPTALDVARLRRSRGRKVHLVMHHEGDSGPPGRVEGIYRLPLYRIAISRRVAAELREEFGCPVADIVPCGVNRRAFFREGEPADSSVLMLYHPARRKGAADGLAALSCVRNRVPGVKICLCGPLQPERLPEAARFTRQPADAELRRLYSTSTALLYPSRYEGFGLPPLEAMACGCPVVTTDVGAVPEFAIDRRNAFIVQPGDVGAMADRLEELLTSATLRAELSTRAAQTACDYSMTRAASLFERALLKALASRS